jgi:hypothetical protein
MKAAVSPLSTSDRHGTGWLISTRHAAQKLEAFHGCRCAALFESRRKSVANRTAQRVKQPGPRWTGCRPMRVLRILERFDYPNFIFKPKDRALLAYFGVCLQLLFFTVVLHVEIA